MSLGPALASPSTLNTPHHTLSCTAIAIASAADDILPFIEPRFLNEKQPQKPHNKLEQAQMTLRENKLNLELKLGGESDNPTSKGIP